MSGSFGWRTADLTAEERAHYAQQHAAAEPKFKRYYECRTKGCGQPPEVYVRYSYITGRAGHVSWQQKPYCRCHGEALVAKKRAAA